MEIEYMTCDRCLEEFNAKDGYFTVAWVKDIDMVELLIYCKKCGRKLFGEEADEVLKTFEGGEKDG